MKKAKIEDHNFPSPIAPKKLKYGDIVFTHLNIGNWTEQFDRSFVGIFFGLTAIGGVILMEIQDWLLFQADKKHNKTMLIRTTFGNCTFNDGGCSEIWVFRRLGNCCPNFAPAAMANLHKALADGELGATGNRRKL